MQNNQLQKALNLSKKTGDRIIVFDSSESQNPYVVMDLNEYEKIVIGHSEVRGLTENELLDKINRDIAIWKTDNENSDFDDDACEKQKNIASEFNKIKSEEDEEEIEGKEEVDEYIKEDVYRDDFSSPGLKEMKKNIEKKKKRWAIPEDRKNVASEEDGEDEDRQYLEEISF